MSEAFDHGITVTEIAAMDQSIAVSGETTAAFVGRALRGPPNTPVLLNSFADYRRSFGDVWSRSSLGPSVQQFFEHGGQRLYVVRVVNGARGAMICLPASGTAVVLRAVEPGSAECIRAAVDYDGIRNDELFNLTLQRLDPETRLIVDQECFRSVSFRENGKNFVGDALLSSGLARLEHPYPRHRPELTFDAGEGSSSCYVDAVQQGTDGKELTDYDLIGSRRKRSGIFALENVESFDLLYLPPPGKGIDAGPTAVLAAELYCRQRGAMLLVDPRIDWTTTAQAVDGVRGLGYASPNMIGYFPRVLDRNDDSDTPRPAGGAIAGLLCKQDRISGSWQDLGQQGVGLQSRLLPATRIDDEDCRLLNRAGLNVLVDGRAHRARMKGSVTMGRGAGAQREFASLPVRRFCLKVVNTVATAARWAVFQPDNAALTKQVRAQVLAYFYALDELGAFADPHFVVQCSAGVSHRAGDHERGISLLLVFRPAGSVEPISLTLHLTAAGCRVGSTAFAPAIEDCD